VSPASGLGIEAASFLCFEIAPLLTRRIFLFLPAQTNVLSPSFPKITPVLHMNVRLTLLLGTQTAFTRGRGNDLVCPFNLFKVFVKLKRKSENA